MLGQEKENKEIDILICFEYFPRGLCGLWHALSSSIATFSSTTFCLFSFICSFPPPIPLFLPVPPTPSSITGVCRFPFIAGLPYIFSRFFRPPRLADAPSFAKFSVSLSPFALPGHLNFTLSSASVGVLIPPERDESLMAHLHLYIQGPFPSHSSAANFISRLSRISPPLVCPSRFGALSRFIFIHALLKFIITRDFRITRSKT